MAKLLAAAPGAPFGSDEGSGRRIWAPSLHSSSALPAFSFTRFEGLNIETFGETEEQPRVQMLCRSDGSLHDEAERLMERARDWMADQHDVTYTIEVGAESVEVTLGYVRSTSGITYLGENAEGNHEWTTSFEVTYG
jgi:hypothetical protein